MTVYFQALISLLMIIFSDIYQLLDFFNFLIWMFYGLNMVALLILKRKNNKSEDKINNKKLSEYRLRVRMEFCLKKVYFLTLFVFLSITSFPFYFQ